MDTNEDLRLDADLADMGLWDHYSGLPNPSWYDYERSKTIRVLFRSDDPDYDWESALSKEPGYELVKCQKVENTINENWPKWSFIVDYKRNY